MILDTWTDVQRTKTGLHTANRVMEHLLQRTTALCYLERQERTSGKVK